jgi:hypothetical protein
MLFWQSKEVFMKNHLVKCIVYVSIVLASLCAEGASESSSSSSSSSTPTNSLVLTPEKQWNHTPDEHNFQVSDFDGSTTVDERNTVSPLANMEEIELDLTAPLTADDLMPYIPSSRNVSRSERRAHIEHVLQRAQSRGGRHNAYLFELQNFVAQQKTTRSIGLPITVNEEHIRPALEWLGKKVLKKDLELVNTKFDRQKVISVVSGAGAFVISSGLACLTAYLGSLYK